MLKGDYYLEEGENGNLMPSERHFASQLARYHLLAAT